MKIDIFLPEATSKEGILVLKDYIDKASINGLEAVTVERAVVQPGEMGAGGILNAVKAVIHAAEKPLVELVKCLQKYVDNYRTTVTIPTKNGNIELKHGRSMSATELKELVTAIQENNT